MWLWTIHHSFCQSPVLLRVAISAINSGQLTMLHTLTTCKETATGAFLTCTNFEPGSKLPEFSGIVVPARANLFSTKAPSSFRSLILNRCCSCHRRQPFSAPLHLPGHCFIHTQLFRRSPACKLWLPVHWQIWDMRSPSKPWIWTSIPWWTQSSIACSSSSHIYVLLRLLCLIHSRVALTIVTRCVTSCVLSRNVLKSLIIPLWCFPSRWFSGHIDLGFAYAWELRGAARSAPEGRTLQVAVLFSRCRARAWRLSSLILKQRMRRWKEITCGR